MIIAGSCIAATTMEHGKSRILQATRLVRRLAGRTACLLLVSCSKEPPPPTVTEFVDDSRLLEATMVRCARNRAESKYTPECLNARAAVDRIAAAEEAEHRQELEAQSARKRRALRRAQEAAAAARERAAEAERLRQEAELLGQYEAVPDEAVDDIEKSVSGSAEDQPPPGNR